MRKSILCVLSLFVATWASAQNYTLPDPKPFGEQIKAADLSVLLSKLASAEMGGRETGEEGQRLAAAFIEGEFKALGLPPKGDNGAYQQKIALQSEGWADLGLVVGNAEYRNRLDFYVYPSYSTRFASALKVKDVIFVGYGREADYHKAKVADKVVLMYDGVPTGQPAVSWQEKAKIAKQKGVRLLLIVDEQLETSVRNKRQQLSTYGWKPISPKEDIGMYANTMFITPAVAQAIMGSNSAKVKEALTGYQNGQKPKALKLKTNATVRMDKETKRLEGSNVIGFIEGSDPVLKDEYVVITAHYDHLGRVDDLIYYGADDNGSGTSGVIEICRAFAAAKQAGVGPKRSVVCMLVSGEEKGLLGSRYYVEFPIFPLEKTVVNVNIDMIGRLDPAHSTNPNYVYVIGSNRMSSELHEIGERANAQYTKMELDYKYNDPYDPNHFYERSDHYNFAERGVPAIFYFNGTHEDYHRTTDQVAKINFDALAKRAQLAFYTAWDVANRPTRLVVDKK